MLSKSYEKKNKQRFVFATQILLNAFGVRGKGGSSGILPTLPTIISKELVYFTWRALYKHQLEFLAEYFFHVGVSQRKKNNVFHYKNIRQYKKSALLESMCALQLWWQNATYYTCKRLFQYRAPKFTYSIKYTKFEVQQSQILLLLLLTIKKHMDCSTSLINHKKVQ